MYDEQGLSTWFVELDSFGNVKLNKGDSKTECPFRYQGQYEDVETGLYYNRFRYYDPNDGGYISQDPIGLAGGNPTLYGYVSDPTGWLDVFGLACAEIKDGVLEIKNKFEEGSSLSNQLKDFADLWNQEIANNGGSMTRQSVSKADRRAASKAAKKYKKANPQLFQNGEVAGHIPDVGWGGKISGPFTPLHNDVNSYIGGATQAVPVGSKYTSVKIVD